MTAADHLCSHRGWFLESKTHRAFQPTCFQSLGNSGRQGGKLRPRCAVGLNLQWRVEPTHCAIYKTTDLIGTAEQLAPTLPFGDHFFRLQRVLCEASARAALAL